MSDSPTEGIVVDGVRIEADLEVTVDGHPLSVRTGEGRVDVFAERVGVLRKIASLRKALPDRVGDAAGRVPLGVHVDGVEVARVDPGVPPGVVSRAAGLAPASVDVGGVVWAVLGLGDGEGRDDSRE